MYIFLICLAQAIFSVQEVQSSEVENTALTPELARIHGYECEVYHVTTEDGYILELHRIPGSPTTPLDRTKLPVMVQHGLLLSSVDWLIPGPDDSLVYMLADKGYDVWLGNARGTVYSRNHVNCSSSDLLFWDFSWHEMGKYDVPAMIDLILKVTGHRQILYVGHSMGTTMFFVMCSIRPEYNAKVRYMMALAPIAFLKFTTSPVRLIVPIADQIGAFMYLFTDGQFKTDSPVLRTFLKHACEQFHSKETICSHFLFLIVGADPIGFNETLTPKIIEHAKNGASTKTLLHYGQQIESGAFQQYDYGFIKNIRIYMSPNPPEYDLSKISVPMTLWYGENDLLGDPQDVKTLHAGLKNEVKLERVNYDLFNHLDFLFGNFVKDILYHHIVTWFESIKHE